MKSYLIKGHNYLTCIFIFVISLLLIGKNLEKPFWGIHDWNGARYGNIARNYLRYGYFTSWFSQIENSGVEERENFIYYTHFPPLLPILISISYRIFGVSEWATRLIPILATSGLIVLIYLIGRTIFDNKIGLLAAALALSPPVVRYFGRNPVHEPLALFFASVAFLGFAKILKNDSSGRKLLLIGTTLALSTNWSGVFLVLAISLVLIKQRDLIVRLWLVGIIVVSLHFLQTYLVTGSFFGGGLLEALLQRTGLGGAAVLTKFTFLEFVNRIRLWSFNLFTISLISSSLFGLYFVIRKTETDIRKSASPASRLVTGILIYALGHPLAFSNATFIHEYFIFYLILPLSLLASYALFTLFKNRLLWISASIVLILLVWFERNPYVKALEESKIDTLAVQIGKELNQRLSEVDTVLVTPYSFGASRLPHLSFYSDRKLTLNQNSRYNWLVEVDEESGSYQILSRQK